MSPKMKIYILAAAIALVIVSAAAASLLNDRRIQQFERSANFEKQRADSAEDRAADLERNAFEFVQKNEYLEEQLSALRLIAAKQDEELKNIAVETNSARGGVRRARAVRSLESTNAELCRKLAALGHPCD